jgi:UDP-GlcNAc:undecaprenyl-phosphate GlcNAc-1-phosphate transferase
VELIIAAVVTAVVTPVVALIATRLGVVDRPGPLKLQERPVPYLGGVAVAVGALGPLAVAWPAALLPLGAALLLGLADDILDLRLNLRLLCEVFIGLGAAAALPDPGIAGSVLTVVAVIVLLNATNLLDGLDGLAAGCGAVSAAGFAVILDGGPQALALTMAGALLGFLLWNRPPARIFLGDAGSYLLGTASAMLLASSFVAEDMHVAHASGALLFVAIPVADTTVAIVRRYRAGRPLLQGDRGHVYDQLVDRGKSGPSVAAICVAAQAVLVVCGVAVAELSNGAAVGASVSLIMLVGGPTLWVFTRPASWQT